MHKDFLACLATKEDPRTVYKRLCESESAVHIERLNSYKADLETIEKIKEALHEKEGSFIRDWAEAWKTQAEEDEANKPDFRLLREARRRMVEEELLALKAQEAEELKRHYHSDK